MRVCGGVRARSQAGLAWPGRTGPDRTTFCWRLTKAVSVCLNAEAQVEQLRERRLIRDTCVQVCSLWVPSTRMTVPGVPAFPPNDAGEHQPRRFARFVRGSQTDSLGWTDPPLEGAFRVELEWV